MNKFKVGEVVLYQNGSRFGLGIVKTVVEMKDGYAYRVFYHMGDTTALTDEELLHKVDNSYAFLIMRRVADVLHMENEVPAQKLADKIIDKIFQMDLDNTDVVVLKEGVTQLLNEVKI